MEPRHCPPRRSLFRRAAAVSLLCAAIVGCRRGGATTDARIEKLEAEVKALRGLVPDQAAVMTIQAYHFTNLWFAMNEENWPLAAFYLSETRKNLRWAARVVPVRKNREGADVNVTALAEAFDRGALTQLQEAIEARDKARAAAAYQAALAGCQGCHDAASKPFIKVRVPAQPVVQIVGASP